VAGGLGSARERLGRACVRACVRGGLGLAVLQRATRGAASPRGLKGS